LRDDVGKALRGGKAADRFGLDPAEFAVLGVEHRLPRDPARREGDDDEMTPRVAILVATDRLVVSGCADEFDGQSGLLPHLAQNRLGEPLAVLHAPAGQGEQAMRGRARPARQQDLSVAKDGRAHRQFRPVACVDGVVDGAHVLAMPRPRVNAS
jgi:hypothetical protein